MKLCGKSSLRLVSTGRAMCQQDLTGKLTPDTTYRVSFFMRLQGVEPVGKGNGGVYAEFWDGDWRYFPRNSAPCGTRDWSYQEYVFKTGKKMPDHPYFHFLISGAKGTAWFDDVRVEELPKSR